MNRIYLLILLAGSSLFMSCDILSQFTQFELPFNSSVTIPGNTGINLPFDITTPQIPTNFKQNFEDNGTEKELIEKILLKSLQLKLTQPADGDLDFLSNLEIFMLADGLPETKVAWKSVAAMAGAKVLNLDLGETNLKDYVSTDWFQLRLHTLTDQPISQDQIIDIASVFLIDAKILGQ
jgi:hypothetical protein